MEKNIAVIWGDCSSPEIVKQTTVRYATAKIC